MKSSAQVVVGSKDVDNINVAVPQQWPRTGWLHDEDGKPLSHFRFSTGSAYVMAVGVPVGKPNRDPVDERHFDWDETSEDGSFSLLSIGPTVQISGTTPDGTNHFGTLEHYGTSSPRDFRATAMTEDHPPPKVHRLSKGLRVSGVVTRRNGEPVANAIVQILSPLVDEMTTTDDNGAFVLHRVPPGHVYLMAGEPIPDPPYLGTKSELGLNLAPMNLTGVKIVLGDRWRPQ